MTPLIIDQATPNVSLDHERTLARELAMSPLPLKADICAAGFDVRYVPSADIAFNKVGVAHNSDDKIANLTFLRLWQPFA